MSKPNDFRSLYSDPDRKVQAAMRERIIREDYGIIAPKSSKEYRNAARHIQLLANGQRKSSRKEEYVAVDNRLKVQYDRKPPGGGGGGGGGGRSGPGRRQLPTAFYLTGTIEYGGKRNRKTGKIETIQERRRNSRMDVPGNMKPEERAELQRVYDTEGYDAAWLWLFFLLTGYMARRLTQPTFEDEEEEDEEEEE